MDVILLQRVPKLGQMGDTVKVRPGFARNFLIPEKKAVRATEANRKRFEVEQAQLEAVNLERRQEAERIAERLDGLKVVLLRQAGESGQLYGSVNARDVANAITEGGVTVQRQQVELARPIKNLGLHPVTIRLHPEVEIDITANVARSLEEAELQASSGRAVVGGEEAEESEDVAEAFGMSGGAASDAPEAEEDAGEAAPAEQPDAAEDASRA
jgi:large subunit ribosomal protein L9